jgi:L-threonylcarbamoyladenylate synthase
MKYTHYSPDAEVILIKGDLEDITKEIEKMRRAKEEEGHRVGIMATEETKERYAGGIVISVGSRSNPETIAANLFKVLREFDEKKVDIILAETIEETGVGHAVMNRLTKAAGYKIVRV